MHTVRNRSYATADRESPSSRISTLYKFDYYYYSAPL